MEAMAVARGLFPNMYSTDVTASAYEGARDQLARLLRSG